MNDLIMGGSCLIALLCLIGIYPVFSVSPLLMCLCPVVAVAIICQCIIQIRQSEYAKKEDERFDAIQKQFAAMTERINQIQAGQRIR